MTTTTVPLHDNRETTYIVQTLAVDTGTCCADNGACARPGVVAVRNVIEQQRPAESSTYRITLCTDHREGADRMHGLWVASARELQHPAKHAAFLASAGVTR